MKKKILFISEASFMKTGFSKITHEILTRLYGTGKYELFEYGSYTQSSDPKALNLPWKFYGAIPEDGDTYGKKRYNSSKFGQFGEAMFEQVLLDCQPDICIDIRDFWMGVSWLSKSNYRDLFKLLTMPTIDGEPQRQAWIDGYSTADAVLTYSQYGKDVLDREAKGLVDVKAVVRPGVNHEIFKPMDKVAIRDKFGISQDSNIIMTVMRNQRRKLFPDLFESFSDYLKQLIDAGKIEKAANTYLYLHTSIADVGFDISKNLLRTGISHKVLMTYVCRTKGCDNHWVDFFQTEVTHCSKCGKMSGTAPNTNFGIADEKLAELYNVADLYIQYSLVEGLGMPLCEAKACGIPSMGQDYTATSEQVNIEGCYPIKVEKFFHEPIVETEQQRALPDQADTIRIWHEFFSLSEEKRQLYSTNCRTDAAVNYSFGRAAKIFEQTLDDMDISDTKKWDSPKELKEIPDIPKKLADVPNSVFVDWCIDNIMHKPELKQSMMRNNLIKDLNIGTSLENHDHEPCNKNTIINDFINKAEDFNMWENQRCRHILGETEKDIEWSII